MTGVNAGSGRDGDAQAAGPTIADIRVDGEEIAALRRYLKRQVRDATEIDDMVQDVYLRVLSAPQTDLVDNARGFLRRVASNLLIDHHRRRAARMSDHHMPLDESIADDRVIGPERTATARQELATLGVALEAIGPVARDAFLLVRVEGYSHKEAANRLGITPKAVSHHVERTLTKLADRPVAAPRRARVSCPDRACAAVAAL